MGCLPAGADGEVAAADGEVAGATSGLFGAGAGAGCGVSGTAGPLEAGGTIPLSWDCAGMLVDKGNG